MSRSVRGPSDAGGQGLGDLSDGEVVHIPAVHDEQLGEREIRIAKFLLERRNHLDKIDGFKSQVGNQPRFRINRLIQIPVLHKTFNCRDDP